MTTHFPVIVNKNGSADDGDGFVGNRYKVISISFFVKLSSLVPKIDNFNISSEDFHWLFNMLKCWLCEYVVFVYAGHETAADNKPYLQRLQHTLQKVGAISPHGLAQ